MNRSLAVAAFLMATAAAFAGFLRRNDSTATAPASAPAAAAADGATTGSAAAHGAELAWTTDLNAALARAKADGKPIFIDFSASWCPPCQQMEKTTFRDAGVKTRLQSYELVRVDVDRNPDVASSFGVRGLPTVVCMNPARESRKDAVGYQSPRDLLKLTEQCARP